MTPQEITALVEKAVGAALTPELVEKMLPADILAKLREVPKTAVALGDETHPETEKALDGVTLSQYLGDMRRLGLREPVRHIDPANAAKAFVRAPMASNGEGWIDDDTAQKAMYTTTSHGGYLVPTEESRQIIDLTHAFSAVRPLCQTVPMRTNSITWPTLTNGLTAYWIPEPTSVATSLPDQTGQASGEKLSSDATFGQFTLTNHVLAVKCVVSNQLLDDADPSIDPILRNLFGKAISSAYDIAMLRGTGAATDPISGLATQIATNILAAGPVFDYDDIIDLIEAVYDNSPTAAQVYCIGHRRATKVLRKLKDNDGQYLWGSPREGLKTGTAYPTIWGEPWVTDGNVSITLGGGGDETRIFAGDFDHAYAAERMSMIVKVNPYAEPYFSYNQTAFLAEVRVGFNVDDEAAFASLNGVPTA